MTTKVPFRRMMLAAAVCTAANTVALAADKASAGEMEEVMVVSQKQPYRGDTPLESLPQAIQMVDSEFLSELGVVQFRDALDLSGGISRQNDFGGLWDSFAVRGFAGDENVPSGYLINGFNAGRGFSGRRDGSNIETVEIMKGPGSALYGRSEPGGTINIVTKKPQFDQEGYIELSVGRYSTKRIEADYTNALSEKVAFRINGSFDDADGYRDNDMEGVHLTPSFLFLLSDSTSLSYELEYSAQEAIFDRGVPAINGDPTAVPATRMLMDKRLGPMEVEATGHQLVLQHELDNGWSILAGLGYRDSSFEGAGSDTELCCEPGGTGFGDTSGGGFQVFFAKDPSRLSRQIRARDFQAEDLSGRIELTGTVGNHHLLFGMDAYEFELERYQGRWRPSGWNDPVLTYSVNIYNPVEEYEIPTTLSTSIDDFEKQSSMGIYFQDQIDLSEQWKLTFGLRYDDYSQDLDDFEKGKFSSQDQTATSPRIGVVWEPTDELSIYASYSEGFRPNSGAGLDGSAFDPEESESSEIGLKWTNGELTGSIALFKSEKSNILASSPTTGESEALGAAESEGIELDLSGNLTDTLSIWFSYAYVDAKTKNEVENSDWDLIIPEGSQLINIPRNNLNVQLVNRFNIDGKEASAGIGLNYVDDRLGETVDPSYILPSYTLVNAFGSYALTDNVKLSVNIDNLLDEEYAVSSYSKLWTMPGSPRTYTLSLRYSL